MTNEKIQKLEELILVLVIVCVALALLIFGRPGDCNDTETYIAAWNDIASGHLNAKRTPVYPCIIGFAKTVGGNTYMRFVIILIQNIAASIAVWYFYKTTRRLTSSQNFSFILALFFACFPIYLTYRNLVLTESLALSGMIFITYCAINIYDGKSKWNYLGFTFWLLFLIFLRPSFLYLIPVFAVAFILMIFKKCNQKMRALGSFVSIFFVLICLLVYMSAFKRTYGVFTSTSIGMVNDTNMMLLTKDLNPNYSKDAKLKNYIREIYDGKDVEGNLFDYIYEMKDYSDLAQTIHKSKTLKNQISNIGFRLHRCLKEPFILFPNRPFIATFINLAFFCGFLTIILYGLALLIYIIKSKKLPWASFLLLMLGASNIIVTVIGAQGEWQRLVFPSKFIYLIMIAQMLLCGKRLVMPGRGSSSLSSAAFEQSLTDKEI